MPLGELSEVAADGLDCVGVGLGLSVNNLMICLVWELLVVEGFASSKFTVDVLYDLVVIFVETEACVTDDVIDVL